MATLTQIWHGARQQFHARPAIRRISSNFLWLSLERVLLILNGLFVGAFVARYLGAASVGTLASGFALAGLLTPVALLGIDRIAVREFVRNPDQRALNATAFFILRAAAAPVLIGGVFVLMWTGALPVGSREEFLLILIALISLLAPSFGIAARLFEADQRNQFAVWFSIVFLAVAAILRVALVLTGADLLSFAWVQAGLIVLPSAGLFGWALWKGHLRLAPVFPWAEMRGILRESWPLILSGLATGVLLNIDLLFLRHMSGESSAGIYSVAARLSMFFYFVPMMLSQVLFPSLLKKESSESGYRDRLLNFFRLNVLGGILLTGLALATFPFVVRWLYGPEFYEAVPVLIVHLLALIFVFLSCSRGQHMVARGMTGSAMGGSIAAAGLNVLLNLLLIPRYGVMGAALATVICQCFYGLFWSFCDRRLVSTGKLQLRALFTPWKISLT